MTEEEETFRALCRLPINILWMQLLNAKPAATTLCELRKSYEACMVGTGWTFSEMVKYRRENKMYPFEGY